MKNFKQIISSAIAFMLLVTLLVPSMSVSAATNYEFKLGLNNIKDDYYEFMAYDIANNQLYELETEARATWSEAWPGHFIVGQDYYTICKPENSSKGVVDLIPRKEDQYVPAVAFTAPADGKYNVVLELYKLYAGKDGQSSYVDVMLIKESTGEILLKEERFEHADLKWVKKNIELEEGERVFVIVVLNPESTRNGGHNVALTSLLVNESVQTTASPVPTGNSQTTAGGGDDAPDNTTAQGNGDVDNDGASEKVDPIIIIACVGGALVVIAIVVGVIVGVKKKKK